MEEMKISDGIQKTIELLESIYVPAKDLEIQGIPLMTAIQNLKIIKEATIRAENGLQQDTPTKEEAELCTE